MHIARLAAETGWSERRIQQLTREAARAGALRIDDATGRGNANRYTLTLDSGFAPTPQQKAAGTRRMARQQAEKRVRQVCTKRRRATFQRDRDQLLLALIERDGFGCRRCGTVENVSIDHVTPLSRGGTDDLDNLQLLCRSCNRKKGTRI
jgi:hypothetical protein